MILETSEGIEPLRAKSYTRRVVYTLPLIFALSGCVKKTTTIQTGDPVSQEELRKYNSKLPMCM